MASKLEDLEDIDSMLTSLGRQVKIYEKLPDTKKIGNIYTDLEKQVKLCEQVISKYQTILDNNNNLKASLDLDNNSFEEKLANINFYCEAVDSNTNMTTQELLRLYLELCIDVVECQNYLSNQRLQIQEI